ncbi:uncharacterized protein LOC133886979 [Phragmites australis]|uniref:uncharacterized protein LOC133886979 n=1 Tax=Phragmites australis TaxID=29695 RepID=UPI002D767145|nr:uncharacterized protein LOC133886979 [Phragmites australis]
MLLLTRIGFLSTGSSRSSPKSAFSPASASFTAGPPPTASAVATSQVTRLRLGLREEIGLKASRMACMVVELKPVTDELEVELDVPRRQSLLCDGATENLLADPSRRPLMAPPSPRPPPTIVHLVASVHEAKVRER